MQLEYPAQFCAASITYQEDLAGVEPSELMERDLGWVLFCPAGVLGHWLFPLAAAARAGLSENKGTCIKPCISQETSLLPKCCMSLQNEDVGHFNQGQEKKNHSLGRGTNALLLWLWVLQYFCSFLFQYRFSR